MFNLPESELSELRVRPIENGQKFEYSVVKDGVTTIIYDISDRDEPEIHTAYRNISCLLSISFPIGVDQDTFRLGNFTLEIERFGGFGAMYEMAFEMNESQGEILNKSYFSYQLNKISMEELNELYNYPKIADSLLKENIMNNSPELIIPIIDMYMDEGYDEDEDEDLPEW